MRFLKFWEREDTEKEKLKAELIRVLDQNKVLNEELKGKKELYFLEEWFNNRYKKTDQLYAGRWMYGWEKPIFCDIRDFFTLNDSELKRITSAFKSKENDDLALECLNWIRMNIIYDYDKNVTKKQEHWNFPFETLIRKKGDCEDGAILLANLMQIAEIPYWKIRLTAGWVREPLSQKEIGHAYVTYFCESSDKWVVLDWCYYPNKIPIKDRLDYKEEENYKGVWFSWNSEYCFYKSTRDLKKKVKEEK